MAKITVGGKEYYIPEMNFLAVERAWPYVLEATTALDPIAGASAALSVIASGLMEADNFNPAEFGIEATTDKGIHESLSYYLKKNLKAAEIVEVKNTMFEILVEAGLEVTEGEARAALTAALETDQADPTDLPETAPDTLSSSSQPDAKEEAGTL